MADQTLNINIVAPEEVMPAALDAFCRQTGWTEENTLTQLEHARLIVRHFFMSTIREYNIDQARKTAASQAAAESDAALDLATMTVEMI